jgi:23S rRNA pseudouridine1911/1915/1917 synthase
MEEGLRLDVFCASRLGDYSRNQIQKMIKSGRVTVGSVQRPAKHVLRSGDEIRIALVHPDSGDRRPAAEDIPIKLVFEDEDIVVVNKHAGIVVHPAAGHTGGTVVNALLGRGIALSRLGGEDRPGVVHRLDKDTSGLLVLAKSDRAYKGLVELISARRVHKVYHAIVWGNIGAPVLKIDAPIGRHPVDRQRMAVTKRGGREALSDVFVVDSFERFDYIRVTIVTGRTHQIRVHLSHISHPVLGDRVYGGRRSNGVSSDAEERARIERLLKLMQRQALHASKISLVHPVTARPLNLQTALPDDMRAALELLARARSAG